MVIKRKEHFNRLVVKGGILCGIALFVASNLQQVAIVLGAGTGKAGFLTATYIVIVPIIGLLFGKKVPLHVWIAVLLTMIGMYLLCLSEELVITGPDILLILCALAFSVQILLISRYSPKTDPIILSCIEFFVCGIITFVPALITELIPSPEIFAAASVRSDAWASMLYCGILSSGIAYTLQIAGQKYVKPTIACLLMSLEAVFSALAGWIMLGETLSLRESAGCVLIFVAVIMAQVTLPGKADKREVSSQE
jgi:drug/metabolite transporter (DMT)-like permease